MSDPNTTSQQPHQSPPGHTYLIAIIAWLVVGIPLAWGVLQTGKTSLALFEVNQSSAPASAPATTPAASIETSATMPSTTTAP